MINLLPPAVKEQIQYSRLNRMMLGYLRLLLLVVVVLAGVFAGTIFYLGQQAQAVSKDHTATQKSIAATTTFQQEAQAVSDRLAAIKYIQGTQTRFSLLLADLAKVLPKSASLDSITLTGDDKKPVRVTVTGSTYESMLAFREALAGSPRISGVDLEAISEGTNGGYQASVVIGFKPGQAR